MNVRLSFFLFAFALLIYRVDSFGFLKCKESETEEKGVGRFLENANCTLQKKRQIINVGLNSIHNTFKAGVDHFKNKFTPNQVTTNQVTEKIETETTTNKYNGLDHQIDVRTLQSNEPRSKREVTGDDVNQGELRSSRKKLLSIQGGIHVRK